MILADASVLIAHLQDDRKATTVLRRHHARGAVLVPAFAAWELWKGCIDARERESVHSLLSSVTVDPFTPALARLAGEMHVRQRALGKERPVIDLLIASHAIHHGAPLATLDRGYDWVEGLDVIRVREEA